MTAVALGLYMLRYVCTFLFKFNITTYWICIETSRKEKFTHYTDLSNQFIFIPVASETSGVIGKFGLDLIHKIGSKIAEATNEKRATSYFIQRLSVCIQKGNAVSILGTIKESKNLCEIFYI